MASTPITKILASPPKAHPDANRGDNPALDADPWSCPKCGTKTNMVCKCSMRNRHCASCGTGWFKCLSHGWIICDDPVGGEHIECPRCLAEI